MNFISYLWKKYKISKAKFEITKKMQEMQEDFNSGKFPGEELDQKYDGDFSRTWALLQGERIKLKQEEKQL